MSDIALAEPTEKQELRTSNVLGHKTGPSDEEIGQSPIVQIPLEEGRAQEIANQLLSELETVQNDRADLEEKLVEWERMYEGKPEQEVKNFPWPHCSNLVVPVIGTAVDTVMATIMNNLFGADKIWKCIARAGAWAPLADPVENWLDWVASHVIKLYQPAFRWFLGTVKFGTGVMKVVWERRLREVHYIDSGGGQVDDYIVAHDGPIAVPISLDNIFWSADADSIGNLQDCSWVAHRFKKSWKQLKSDETSGIYYDVDKIKDATATNKTAMEEQREEQTHVIHTDTNSYELYEFWASVDLKENGVLAEIVLTVEKSTQTVLRAVYNFYLHQERPFHLIRYMPRDHGILGIGIAEMLDMIQKEISSIHNQRLDNGTIANANVFKRKRDSRVDELEIYPGAFIDVDEMDDIDVMELGSEHSTLLQEELHSNAIGEKRTAVNDYSVGRESAAIGSNATATSVTSLLRESAKRFDMTKRDFRSAIRNIGHQIIMLYKQFAPDSEVMYEMFSEEEKAIVSQYFQLPDELSRNGILIDIPAVSEINNKEMQQQILMTLMKVVQEYYMAVMQSVQVATMPNGAVSPQVQQLAIDASVKGTKFFKRLLESFGFRDADDLVPNMEQILGMGMGMGLGGLSDVGNLGTPGGMGPGAPGMGGGTGPIPGGGGSPTGMEEGPSMATGAGGADAALGSLGV